MPAKTRCVLNKEVKPHVFHRVFEQATEIRPDQEERLAAFHVPTGALWSRKWKHEERGLYYLELFWKEASQEDSAAPQLRESEC